MNETLFSLRGKVALVTGANSGLGLAYARGLAKAGASVVIWGRRDDKNRLAVAELEQYDVRIASRVVDVAKEEEVIAGIQAVVDEFGRLDCVVANAGISGQTPTLELNSQDYHGLLDVNLHGAFYTLRAGAAHMAKRAQAGDPGGSLIVCGSLAIFAGVPGMAHYAMAKGALNSLVKTLAVEFGPLGIRANLIAPGFIATEMTQANPAMFEVVDKMVSARTALGRSGTPEDLEGAVIYLASDLSRYHTGDSLVVDGGQLAKLM